MLPIHTALDGSYEVEPRWLEEVVYREATGATSWTPAGADPGVLHVPWADGWNGAAPAWLRGRRDVVVSRLAEHSRHRVEPNDAAYAPGDDREVRR